MSASVPLWLACFWLLLPGCYAQPREEFGGGGLEPSSGLRWPGRTTLGSPGSVHSVQGWVTTWSCAGREPLPILFFEWPLDLVPSREAESVAMAGAMRKCGCQAVWERGVPGPPESPGPSPCLRGQLRPALLCSMGRGFWGQACHEGWALLTTCYLSW